MSRVLESVAPARLGHGFRWLLASSWLSNLGDGVAVAAVPLLVASMTHDPFFVALATVLRQLPWLAFGLLAGALADRGDRRRIVAGVDLARAVVLAVLCVTLATGTAGIALVLVCVLLVGTAEVFADTTSQTLLPMLVAREDLGVANSRMMAGYVTVNQLVGPPIGAALFVAGTVWPFLGQAVLVAAGAGLVARVALPAREPRPRSAVRHDVLEGLRWVRHQPAVRTLALTVVTFNVTFGAAWSVLVLWSQERLGLDDVGFGLLTTVGAVGGLLGTALYGRITARISMGDVMRVGLVIETVTHLVLALTTSPTVAYVVFFVFGAHAFIWTTTSVTVRQHAVPEELQGRVTGLSQVGSLGGMVVGSVLGGVIAHTWGVTAPFWFAFVGSAVLVVLIWRQLPHIAHAEARAVPHSE